MHFPLIIEKALTMPEYFWHPSVVYVPDGLGGHNWRMAQTPFPHFSIEPYRDRYEIPCIHYSDDGITWKSILNNPIDELTAKQIDAHDYFSDPHLIYKNGTLELYYRLTILKDKQPVGNKTILYKRTSDDGFNWSPRVLIADLRNSHDVEIWGEQIISPAIIWNGHYYQCWYVDASKFIEKRNIRTVTSTDGLLWTANRICEHNLDITTPWHLDVQFWDGLYRMVLYNDKSNDITYFESKDGYSFRFRKTLLTTNSSPFSFYFSELYRSCIVKGKGQIVSLFFSGANYISMHSFIGRLDSSDMVKWKPRGKMTFPYLLVMVDIFVTKLKRKILKFL